VTPSVVSISPFFPAVFYSLRAAAATRRIIEARFAGGLRDPGLAARRAAALQSFLHDLLLGLEHRQVDGLDAGRWEFAGGASA
jgi:hypothetical protein